MAAFAQSHSEDMAFNNFLSHDGSDGSFGERMAGYSMTFGEQIGGEILAIGTPQNAMEQWRRDEHWDYVLRPHYTQIRVGYVYNSCSDFGGYLHCRFSLMLMGRQDSKQKQTESLATLRLFYLTFYLLLEFWCSSGNTIFRACHELVQRNIVLLASVTQHGARPARRSFRSRQRRAYTAPS